MSELVFDAPGERFYETGVSQGVLFPHTGGAYVWNGLTNVEVSSSGGELESLYYDGRKYMDRILAEDFQATITALNTPRAFDQCEGIQGQKLKSHFGKRIKFNLVWVTKIGNDQNQDLGEKMHIAYNCLVQPSANPHSTIEDISTAESRSFTITTTPACGIYSYYTIDSRDGSFLGIMSSIKAGVLPSCDQLIVGVDVPLPPDEETECVNLRMTFDDFNPGQSIDMSIDDPEEDSEIIIHGVINNGLDIVDLPANGAFDDNDSESSPSVVGSGTVLADDNDATYITSAAGDLGYTIALPDLTGGYTPGSEFELHIRMSINGGINPDDPDNLDAEAQVHISTDAAGEATVGGFSDGAQDGMAFRLDDVDGNIVDYVVPLRMNEWIDTDISDVVDALEAGAYLNIRGADNFNQDPAVFPLEVRVYEATIRMLNDTDEDRYLRAFPDTNSGYVTEYIWNPAHTDQSEQAFTTFVDFKIKKVPNDSSYSGVTKKVIQFEGDNPGSLTATVVGGVPTLQWRDVGSGSPNVSITYAYDTWYSARVYWTWGFANVKVWTRDESSVTYLINRDIVTDTSPPTTQVRYNAGLVGG